MRSRAALAADCLGNSVKVRAVELALHPHPMVVGSDELIGPRSHCCQ